MAKEYKMLKTLFLRGIKTSYRKVVIIMIHITKVTISKHFYISLTNIVSILFNYCLLLVFFILLQSRFVTAYH